MAHQEATLTSQLPPQSLCFLILQVTVKCRHGSAAWLAGGKLTVEFRIVAGLDGQAPSGSMDYTFGSTELAWISHGLAFMDFFYLNTY